MPVVLAAAVPREAAAHPEVVAASVTAVAVAVRLVAVVVRSAVAAVPGVDPPSVAVAVLLGAAAGVATKLLAS